MTVPRSRDPWSGPSFRRPSALVDDVSFSSVPEGQVLGVIGPNGAGKSTFINLVTGHIRPTSGTVLIEGRDMTGAKPWVIAHAGWLAPSRSSSRSVA